MQINSINSPSFSALYVDKSVGRHLRNANYDTAESKIKKLTALQEEFKDYKHVDVIVYEDGVPHKGGGTMLILNAKVRSKEDPKLQVDSFSLGNQGYTEFNVDAISKENGALKSLETSDPKRMFTRFEFFNNYTDASDNYKKLSDAVDTNDKLTAMCEYARQVETNRARQLQNLNERTELQKKQNSMVDEFMGKFGL